IHASTRAPFGIDQPRLDERLHITIGDLSRKPELGSQLSTDAMAALGHQIQCSLADGFFVNVHGLYCNGLWILLTIVYGNFVKRIQLRTESPSPMPLRRDA